MALSMDEQRILEEMERKLADEDPALAARLTSFGHRGVAAALRSRRVRVVLAVLVLAIIAVASVLVYVLSPFRAGARNQGRPAAPQGVSQSTTASPRSMTVSPGVTTKAVGSPQP
jgi:Protein of unknown function (DUF3040)